MGHNHVIRLRKAVAVRSAQAIFQFSTRRPSRSLPNKCHLFGEKEVRLSNYSISEGVEAGRLAERVGFEPTCPVTNQARRFRGAPVTTTSVPLRASARRFDDVLIGRIASLVPWSFLLYAIPPVAKKVLHQFSAVMLENTRNDRQPVRYPDVF